MFLTGCQIEAKKSKSKKVKSKNSITIPEVLKKSSGVKKSLHAISDNKLGILVDLKYATTDNFMHQMLYFNVKEACVQNFVFKMLLESQTKLNELHPGWHLLVYDAGRPLEVQKRMWKALDSIPVKERIKFVSSPSGRSLHNYGCAIDLTILDGSNKPLDMGSGFDEFKKIAHPSMEDYYLKSGELNQIQINNRKLLRFVMNHSGFKVIPTEWWHFNACTKAYAKKHFELIQSENQLLPR